MRYWFTSDCHFGHFNIIEYTNRPFDSLEKMDATLIKNWNSRVKPEDIVFHIGDFCFKNSPGGKKGEGTTKKPIEYEKQLNGKIIHIKGNHDRNNSCKTIIENMVIRHGGERIFLVHKPEHYNNKYKFNFCGHIHNNWEITERIKKGSTFNNKKKCILINVGIDVWNFYPVTLEEIMRRYNKWEKENQKK